MAWRKALGQIFPAAPDDDWLVRHAAESELDKSRSAALHQRLCLGLPPQYEPLGRRSKNPKPVAAGFGESRAPGPGPMPPVRRAASRTPFPNAPTTVRKWLVPPAVANRRNRSDRRFAQLR